MSNSRLPSSLIAAALLLLLLSGQASGQSTTGTILGVVTDETGASLPGAMVTATHLGTNISRTLVTDMEGRYRAPSLPLGMGEEATLVINGYI